MSLNTINDLTAVDESQLQNNALIEGAIPPVSGSIFAPVKVTLAKLAKWILNSYTGLSLAGSSQSVKSAVDTLNGNVAAMTYEAGELIPDNSNLNDYTTPGVYRCPNAASAQTISNSPVNVGYRLEVKYILSGERFVQIIYANTGSNVIYYRVNNGSWNSWRLVNSTAVS